MLYDVCFYGFFSANFPPTIENGEVVLQLVAGENYTDLVELNVTDKNGDAVTFSVVSGSVSGVAVDSSSGVVSFINVPDENPFIIKISVTDGKVSTVWEPKIQYCACQVCNIGPK